MNNPPIIELKNISYKYPNGKLALDCINFSLYKGEKLALLGSNGSGKSTLMFVLNGLYKPYGGTYNFQSKPLRYKKKELIGLRNNIGVVFQEPDNQIIAPTVYEELTFGAVNIGVEESEIRNRVKEVAELLNLEDVLEDSPHELSYGQKKRVVLASVLVMKPQVIVMDEPTAALDGRNSDKLKEYINVLTKQGITIIMSSHDTDHIMEWADRVIVLDKGQVIRNANPKEVFHDESIYKTTGIKKPYAVETRHVVSP